MLLFCKMNKRTNPQRADLLGTLGLALKTLKETKGNISLQHVLKEKEKTPYKNTTVQSALTDD